MIKKSRFGSWLICRPTFFEVIYEINPWMSVQRAPSSDRAKAQWGELERTLTTIGADLHYVEPHKGLPDMVFTANAGIVRGNTAIVSRFKFRERQGEESHFDRWYRTAGFDVVPLTKGHFEGEGDAFFIGDTLFGGYGFRSDLPALEETRDILGLKKLVACALASPHFYHLDTCFCPLSTTQALYYPPAFTPDGIAALKRHITLYEVPEADATKFACNSVVLDKKVITPANCHETKKILERHGFEVFPVELNEFLKAGGSAKCLTNRLDWPHL